MIVALPGLFSYLLLRIVYIAYMGTVMLTGKISFFFTFLHVVSELPVADRTTEV